MFLYMMNINIFIPLEIGWNNIEYIIKILEFVNASNAINSVLRRYLYTFY